MKVQIFLKIGQLQFTQKWRKEKKGLSRAEDL